MVIDAWKSGNASEKNDMENNLEQKKFQSLMGSFVLSFF